MALTSHSSGAQVAITGRRVLVTGGSGFVAMHCLLQLLQAGYRVRTTLRSSARESDLRTTLARAGAGAVDRLEFQVADLNADAGWREAVAGCDAVLHVASPLPARAPRHEDELVVPARAGALRVLRAARDAGVRRVVQTSSFAAIGYGHPPLERPFTEHDWTDAGAPGLAAYPKSKTLAERAAWDFMAREGGAMELATVNPVAVFGPVLGADFSASIEIVRRMLDGALPALPRLAFGVVDVRDVADLHLRALAAPAAAGERFIATAGDFMSLRAVAQVLRERLGGEARRVPLRELPDWLTRLLGRVNASVGQIVPELGKAKNADSAKARRVLGWAPRPREEAIVATAESLLRLGVVKR